MKITFDTKQLNKLAKKLERIPDASEKVLRATTSDFRTRAPGWVATAVTGVYNIKKKEITPVKKKPKKTAGSISVRGRTISKMEIVYTGRLLTPVHFGMRPGQRRGNKQRVTAEIKKGQRKLLQGAFLGSNGGGGYIPFKRVGKARKPIEAIRTLSLPQMVDNPDVRSEIDAKIWDGLSKRVDNNIKRFFK